MVIVEAVNNRLTSYVRLCNYVMLNSIEPIKVAHRQILANQSVLSGALVIEKWLNNSFSESKKNFCRLIKYERLKYIFPLDFAKYLSSLEVQKNSKFDIRKKEACSKSVKKTFYGSKFLVSEYIFKLIYH